MKAAFLSRQRWQLRSPLFVIHFAWKAKRHDTTLLFFAGGLSWSHRQSHLFKIVKFQNEGHIERIYTLKMAEQFEEDLRSLKTEFSL